MSLIKQYLHHIETMNTTLNQERVLDYCTEYTAVLRASYIKWRIQCHYQGILNNDSPEYHQEKIEKLTNGTDENTAEFTINEGKKYFKVVMKNGLHGSVHAFVNKQNGDVYKPASWKAPVKDARYNILDDVSREHCFTSVDPFGSYLYK